MFLYNMKRGACESTPFVYHLYTHLLSYQHFIYAKNQLSAYYMTGRYTIDML